MKRAALLALLIVSLACEARAPATAASSAPAIPTHREKARAVLEDHCGACHIPDPLTGTALALHIYDLTQPDWSATLSDEQLPILEQKLWEDAGDERERAILRDFVVEELAWREAQRRSGAR